MKLGQNLPVWATIFLLLLPIGSGMGPVRLETYAEGFEQLKALEVVALGWLWSWQLPLRLAQEWGTSWRKIIRIKRISRTRVQREGLKVSFKSSEKCKVLGTRPAPSHFWTPRAKTPRLCIILFLERASGISDQFEILHIKYPWMDPSNLKFKIQSCQRYSSPRHTAPQDIPTYLGRAWLGESGGL